MMMVHDAKKRSVTFENETLRVGIDYKHGLCFSEVSNRFFNKPANLKRDFFNLRLRGRQFKSADFRIEAVKVIEDKAWEMVTFFLSLAKEKIYARIHVINDRQDKITVLYQVKDDYLTGVPTVVEMHIPFLAGLESGGKSDVHYYPSNPVTNSNGKSIIIPMREMFYSTDVLLPLVVCEEGDQFGFMVNFPVPSDLTDVGAAQNVNKLFSNITSEKELKEHWIQINPDSSYNDTVEFGIVGLKDGWSEAFERNRTAWEANYDFSEYDKPDLKWFSECGVHSFLFLYGSEVLDHDTLTIDVDKVVKEGEAFGGFDTVTIWNQYPRLGIDKRSQWDFYNDFPGGREAIRKAVDKFHEKGIKVLLPLIPWDRGEFESNDDMGDSMAQIIIDTDADGFHLDTMRDLPYSIRLKLNKVKPGIVLETQSHPLRKHPVEFITTSWDEFWYTDPMPEVDVFRFMNPRHIAPVVARWSRDEDKWKVLKRTEFGGAPVLIWQDIFGRWMPFSDAQKARIKDWKKTYMTYREVYQGLKPTPLVPLNAKDLYCNRFRKDSGDQEIYSFYNDSDSTKQLRSFSIDTGKVDNVKKIYGSGSAKKKGNGFTVSVAAREILHVLVKYK